MSLADVQPAVSAEGTVRVLFFGKVGDRFGRARDVAIPLAGCTLAALKQALGDVVEGGAEALAEAGVRAAVEREMALGFDVVVRPGQEVAFFSAFSGG